MQEQKRIQVFEQAKKQYLNKEYAAALESFYLLRHEAQEGKDHALIQHYLGLCSSHLERFDESKIYFENALKHDPANGLLRLHYGMMLYFSYNKNTKEKRNVLLYSQQLIEQSLIEHHENAEGWYYHGLVSEQLGKMENAQNSFSHCLQCDKKHPNVQKSELFDAVQK